MKKFVFDLETTGLDTEACRIHCVVVREVGGPRSSYRPHQVADAVAEIQRRIDAGEIACGHNIVEYDLPILRRYGLRYDPTKIYDTLVISRAAYPGSTLYVEDREKRYSLKDLKPGMHSLASWGLRLGNHKGDYDGGWEEFSEDMLAYNEQDVDLNVDLVKHLEALIPDEAALLECHVAEICRRMRLHGVCFDVDAAVELTKQLASRREQIEKQMAQAFKPWYVPDGTMTPKVKRTSKELKPGTEGYVNVAAGCPYTKVKRVDFNPSSADHIASRFQKIYGWKPKQYTEKSGRVQITSEILEDLPYPEAKPLAEYFELQKILGYVAEGKGAWLKLEKEGRLHGKVQPTGTVSGRASHSNPNTGNVPTRSELGHRCRALFTASPGKVLVGADAAQLQLRDLAHYTGRWDGGALAKQCEEGDIHEFMRQGTQLLTRDFQKTWTYAMLFGAQDLRLGLIVLDDHRHALEKGKTTKPLPKMSQAKMLGARSRANLGNAVKAFPLLDKELEKAAARGYLITHDGRSVPISSKHIAIAMLLQGGEAVIMKLAMAIAAPQIYALGGEFVLWVHDEFQVECHPNVAWIVGGVLVDAIRKAGEMLQLRVKLNGNYKIGTTWAETH